ncbi:MAG: ATP-dependent helicase HrpB [Planctomycetes bacterium]|nr:ATP-dependent helicase HrpB [Planctomycetota bacterium]
MIALPVDAVVPDVVAALERVPSLTVSSPPGSGKTTRIPIALVRAFGTSGDVVVLEPRRIAARAAARRVASEIGDEVGGQVGYEVRDDRRVSRRTRLRFVTEGVLVNRIVRDPFLEGVSVVVLDEFHERHIDTDLALSMLREVRDTVRPDLRIVVMSATLDVEPVRSFLEPCGHIAADGGLFEVAVEHLEAGRDLPLAARVRAGVVRALDETEGHVLVFLPGMGEIRAAERELDATARRRALRVLPLHGQLDAERQDEALRPSAARKVVLATNVAESSITIDGVTAVVDTGLARVLRHDPARGMDVLRTESISLASAEQRAGRAGRTGPGRCYRLWSVAEERGMPAFDAPEIRRVDLAGPSLAVRAFSAREPSRFGWFEAPDAASLERADQLSRALGAVAEDGRITAIGEEMLRLPLHPRLARMAVESVRRRCLTPVATIAALLAERDLSRSLGVDLHAWVEAFERAEADRFRGGRGSAVDLPVARAVARTRDRLVRALRGSDAFAEDPAEVGKCVLAGFADRVVRCDADGNGQLATGRGVIVDDPALATAGLAVALRVDDRSGASRSRVRLALAIERDWLADVMPDAIHVERVAEFAPGGGNVVMVRRTRFLDLVLEEQRGGEQDPVAVEDLLASVVRRDPFTHLGDAKSQRPLRRFLARVAWLRSVAPELELPDLNDSAVGDALASLAPGKRDLRAFRGAPLLELLESGLSRSQRERLRVDAPERIRTARGKELRVEYDDEPFVAARLQEFFGTPDTPRLGGGRVPVQLRLLAPNMRPVQITSDLASFWRNVYPGVRSELRNRYPKHAWPEDPLA